MQTDALKAHARGKHGESRTDCVSFNESVYFINGASGIEEKWVTIACVFQRSGSNPREP